LGEVRAAERREGLLRLSITAPYAADGIDIGASIAHDGCCLTVVEKSADGAGSRYVVEVAPEGLALTTLGALKAGDKVNLERSLRVGDELGGHMVLGHVDGVGEILSVQRDGEGWRLKVKPPREISHLIAAKGSVAIAGVSLTVNEAEDDSFGVGNLSVSVFTA
jgi:riboflavin synthase